MFILIDHGFSRMEECIHSLISSEFLRDTHHEAAVDNRKAREHGFKENPCLFLCRFICDDRGHIDFRACAGRCCDGNDRRSCIKSIFLSAVKGEAVVPDGARVRHHECNALRAVHDGTAAQGNDEITSCLLCLFSAVHDIFACRVRADFVEDFIGNAGQIEFMLYIIQISVLLDGRTI